MFSDQLKERAQPILQAIYDHPFVKGIQNGSVPKEALIFYVQQDHQYLGEFVKIYGNIISVANDPKIAGYFNQQIDFLVNEESFAHQIICKVAGVDYNDLFNAVPSPKAYLYESHMHRAGETKSLLNILAALAPCPWTYLAIARHLVESGADNETNPFSEWIKFYYDAPEANDYILNLMDQLAAEATQEERQIATQYFLKSCELEWQFWEQSYYQQDWHFKSVLTGASKEE